MKHPCVVSENKSSLRFSGQGSDASSCVEVRQRGRCWRVERAEVRIQKSVLLPPMGLRPRWKMGWGGHIAAGEKKQVWWSVGFQRNKVGDAAKAI